MDAFEFFVAPKFLGGQGCPVIGGRGWRLAEGPELHFMESRNVGDDIWIRAVPARRRAEI